MLPDTCQIGLGQIAGTENTQSSLAVNESHILYITYVLGIASVIATWVSTYLELSTEEIT